MSSTILFNVAETMMIHGALAELRRGARGTALCITLAVLAALFLLGIAFVDWEIYFRIFQYMTEGGDYWSPHLMACTPAIMLIGYHLLATRSPRHPVVRLVGALASGFVLAFVLGGGVYIAAMLYDEAGVPGQLALALPSLGGIPPDSEAGGSWLDGLMANVTSPLGALAMSLGIGGLSVVSVWAGHWLITIIEHNLRQSLTARRNLREGLGYWRECQQAQTRFAELTAQYERMRLCSDEQLLIQIAGLTLKTIGTHALPHEQRLQEMRFAVPRTALDHDQSEEITRGEKALKPIRAIGLDEVLKALTPTTRRSIR